MIFADLHVHTRYSDGTLEPRELLREADKAGLSAIAVVDHDTVDAVAQSIQEGLRANLEVLPGIELTSEHHGQEIHLLGYLIDYTDAAFLKKLAELRQNRIERIFTMVKKIKDSFGLTLDPQAVFDMSRGGTVGRLHVAQAMVKQGLASSVYEAFYKYIGDDCPGYVAGFKLSTKEAIALIKQVGGIPVLAHPYTIRRDELIPEFVSLGLMGLEAYYSEHSQGTVNFYKDLAVKYNLLVTGGSDFHGEAKPNIKLGSIKIPYELVEKLKAAKLVI